MESKKPIEHLVLDTGAVILNHTTLHNLANTFYAPPEVPEEFVSEEARRIYSNLPFDIIIREPSNEAVKKVIDAAKKTGDYKSLSIPDLKVIALTFDLQRQLSSVSEVKVEADAEVADLSDKLEKSTVDDSVESVTESEKSEDSDDEGWITKDNIEETLKKLGGFEVEEDSKVACLTTDFALQNVLLFMNLPLVSVLGYRIRKIRSHVLRCRACYETTSVMTKEFCPTCGHKMLHKCATSVDENGKQVLHINWNRLANRRGLQYSLPAPKGGKHAVNEKLFEDQPMPHLRMAKTRNDPLADGPFSMHDVNSRSAHLGVRTMMNGKRTARNRNEAKQGGRRK